MSAGNDTKRPPESTSENTESPSPATSDPETEESASLLHCYNAPDYRLDPEILGLMQATTNQAKRQDKKNR
jgi:hypothetical protein